MNPFNLLRLAGSNPLVKKVIQGIYAVAPDVVVGAPLQLITSPKPSPKKEKATVLNTAAEVGTSLVLGGAETIPQLGQLATDPAILKALGREDLANSRVVKDINARMRTINPSMYTEQLVEQIVEGKIDAEKQRLMEEARRRVEQMRLPHPTSDLMLGSPFR